VNLKLTFQSIPITNCKVSVYYIEPYLKQRVASTSLLFEI